MTDTVETKIGSALLSELIYRKVLNATAIVDIETSDPEEYQKLLRAIGSAALVAVKTFDNTEE